ncbi:arsenate reductase family protein [Heyndrickxia acidiproducens]|uniref:arsenate reductase family protein n=1 Tax=Heyndrickxia acidiproducens TaxID=1121084 RepID=UPI00037D90B0|nr:arsenate reductase family protein [Heyndrickxia acidiproducens]
MALVFYWYPKCGTCRKAKKWLDEHSITYDAIHIVENPPSKAQLKEYYEKSGLELKKLFNTSGRKYRELGLKDKIPAASENELLEWLASDGMLIKRPILADGDFALFGFKEENYEKLLVK